MIIAISTVLSTRKMTGVAVYLINLIDSLQKSDDINEYYILTTPHNKYMFDLYKPNFKRIVIPVFDYSRIFLRLNYILWQLFRFNHFLQKNKIELIHFPSPWFIPSRINTVVTIHDLVEFKFKKYSSFNNYLKKLMIKVSIKNSKNIISVSQSTANDIEYYFQKTPTVIYNGNKTTKNSLKENSDQIVETRNNYKEIKYFIFIGTLLKHKNLENTLEAFKLFAQTNNYINFLIIGKKDNGYISIWKKILKYELKNRIKILGYVDNITKEKIFSNALCLIYCSNYEGFGFPILEAQSLGIPVITSNNSAMPEIAGNGAILVDPNNIYEICIAMKEIVEDRTLREDLISKGYENIKKYSWEDCALKTVEVYNGTF